MSGGASGLGLSLAKQLVQRGSFVTILDVQDASPAAALIRKLSRGGAKVQTFRVDVRNKTEVRLSSPACMCLTVNVHQKVARLQAVTCRHVCLARENS